MTLVEEERSEFLREEGSPVLKTERLILRVPRLEDAKAVAQLANDRRIAENTARIPHPYRLADAEAFIAGASKGRDEVTFLITLDRTVIGCCGLARLDGPAPDLGYWIGVPFWGNGYATEAVRALLEHAFTDLGHEVLQSAARVTNPASRRVLEKCGFQWTGVGLCRVHALASSVPVDRFRLERSIWASLRNWGKVQRLM